MDVFQVLNAVRDTGMCPEMITHNYCLSLGYPGKAIFAAHFDSRFQWGEVVLGVSLGAPCMLRCHPVDKNLRYVNVSLPRRSAYVMTGQARDQWKHSIHGVRNTPCPWNRSGMRRSLTLRA